MFSKELKEAAKRLHEKIKNNPNINGIGIGAEETIIVHFIRFKKKPKIPDEWEGFKVKKVTIGKIRAL